MKTEHSEKTVRVKRIPKLTEEPREELLKLAAMSDDDIDYSDIRSVDKSKTEI